MTDRDLMVAALPGIPPEPGAALWLLEDTRSRTLDVIEDRSDRGTDRVPTGLDNSIGSLLYRLAAIEADWLPSRPGWRNGSRPTFGRKTVASRPFRGTGWPSTGNGWPPSEGASSRICPA